MKGDFSEILKKAEAQLISETDPYEGCHDTDAIYALADFMNDPESRAQVIKFIENAFDKLREDAKKGDLFGSHLINAIIFGAVGRLAGIIGEKTLAPLIYREFQFAVGEDKHYELNMEGGTLAIVLSLLEYKGETRALHEFLKSYEHRYVSEKFIMEVRYALWIIEGNKKEPIEYLKTPESVIMKTTSSNIIGVSGNPYKNLGYIAATLADLNAKESLPLLSEYLQKIKNPITKEIFIEAISRLENQIEAPLPKDRMICMFGRRSSGELVLGDDDDREFVLRARNKTKDLELGNIIEVDQSAVGDL